MVRDVSGPLEDNGFELHATPGRIGQTISALAILLILLVTAGAASEYPSLSKICQASLLVLCSYAVGVLLAFLLTFPRDSTSRTGAAEDNTAHSSGDEVMVRVARTVGVGVTGISGTLAFTKGGEFLDWLSADTGLPRSVVLLSAVPSFIAGLLGMYFWYHLILKFAMDRAWRRGLERQRSRQAILDAMPSLLGTNTPTGEAPAEAERAAKQLAKGTRGGASGEYQSLLAEGIALKSEEKPWDALAKLNKARTLNQEDYRIPLALAAVQVELESNTEASQNLDFASALMPPAPPHGFLKLFAQTSLRVGRYDDAVRHYSKYLDHRPSDHSARLDYAKALARQAAQQGDSSDETANDIVDVIDTALKGQPELWTDVAGEAKPGGAFEWLAKYKGLVDILKTPEE